MRSFLLRKRMTLEKVEDSAGRSSPSTFAARRDPHTFSELTTGSSKPAQGYVDP